MPDSLGVSIGCKKRGGGCKEVDPVPDKAKSWDGSNDKTADDKKGGDDKKDEDPKPEVNKAGENKDEHATKTEIQPTGSTFVSTTSAIRDPTPTPDDPEPNDLAPVDSVLNDSSRIVSEPVDNISGDTAPLDSYPTTHHLWTQKY
jgi:hypothetical protein